MTDISEEERARRQEAIDYARGSVRLEGFVISEEAEAINQRYVAGEMTSDEHSKAIRRLHGL